MIRGELGDRLEDYFEGMSLSRETGNTVLVGDVADQAHLHRVIERIQSLGCELVSVNSLESTATSAPPESGRGSRSRSPGRR